MLLVLISVPAIGLLFFQNRQVQTSISSFLTSRLAEEIDAGVSISSVKYSFFKRLYLYDFLIEDQSGDTLLYSESTRIKIKDFKPRKQIIHFHSLSCENFYMNVKVDMDKVNNLKFFSDWLKSDLPPEEKVVLRIDEIELINSHFSQTVAHAKSPPYGIDFSDMDVYNLNAHAVDFIARMDTVYMNIVSASGLEKTGFIMKDASFGLTIGRQFMTFNDGTIISPGSKASIPVADFRFNDWMDFQEVYDSVDTYIASSNSYLTFPDLAYFFHQLEHANGEIFLDGKVFGKFGDLFGEDIEVSYKNGSQLDFDMNLIGMPSQDSVYMIFDIKQFRSDMNTLKSLTSYYEYALFKDTVIAESIGTFNYSGKFSGYLTDFETDGKLETKLGDVLFDLNMKPDTARSIKYKGSLQTQGFQIGKFLRQEEYIENVSLNINVDGTNKNGQVDLLVKGMIDSLGIYDYNYRNINLEGNILNKTFDGAFSIKDPNIDMNFAGRVDFEEKIPQLNFTVDVANLRPYYLKLRDDDPEYFASFFLKTNLSGINIDQLNGELHLVNSFFKRTGSQVQIYDFKASTQNSDSSFISLKSDILDADLHGNYSLSKLPSTLLSALNNHLELFPELSIETDTISNFDFTIDVKEANPLLEFFFPKFQIAEGSMIEGYYRPSGSTYEFALDGALPYFKYNGFHWEDLAITSRSDRNQFALELESERMSSESDFEIIKPKISSTALDNRTDFAILWDNDSLPLYKGGIKADGLLSSISPDESLFSLHIDSSWFYYSDSLFVIPESSMAFKNSDITLDSVGIYGNNQHILADGSYSANENDKISINVSNVRLDNLSSLSETLHLNIEGRMSGDAVVKKENSKPLFISDLVIDSLFLNNNLIGNTSLIANWQEQQKKLLIDLKAVRDSVRSININGSLEPASGLLDFNASLTEVALSTFSPYLEDIMDDVGGYLGAAVNIDGTLRNPEINGNIFLEESTFELIETRTEYSISDNIRIYKNNLFFNEFSIYDNYENRLNIEGNITSSNFQNFIINLDLDAENFNFLNTSRIDNEQFYGDIFASANVTLRGPLDELDIKVTAETEKHTNLNLPLYNAAEIQTTDFITFRRSEEIVIEREEEKIADPGVTLDMDLEISSGANVQLIFDPKVGDIIEASGRGNLKIKMDESGTLTMFGDVLIQDGEYLFTLQNVINKKFRVESGGNIVWSGSPTDAVIDLQAIYELKAAPYNLSPEPTQSESLKKRIPVHCLLSLQGDLSNPGIKPSIVLPTAEPETRTLLDNNIGTEEELMRQFISLLVINSFMSASGIEPDFAPGINAAEVTASELLSNQLSNILSQISNDFDIGVNYRPGDLISSDEIEVALSTQLFDDRVILSGNLDVGGNDINTPTTTNNIVGDFNLEFKVTDKISLKAFNRANDDFRIHSSLYTQGVGVLYRNEFNEFSDLFQRKKKKKSPEDGSSEGSNEAVIKEDD